MAQFNECSVSIFVSHGLKHQRFLRGYNVVIGSIVTVVTETPCRLSGLILKYLQRNHSYRDINHS